MGLALTITQTGVNKNPQIADQVKGTSAHLLPGGMERKGSPAEVRPGAVRRGSGEHCGQGRTDGALGDGTDRQPVDGRTST